MTSHSVIVTHSGRAYTLRLFDRLLLRVCVETSHAHGHSLGLKLLQCQPLEPESGLSGGGKDATTKALVKVKPCSIRREMILTLYNINCTVV